MGVLRVLRRSDLTRRVMMLMDAVQYRTAQYWRSTQGLTVLRHASYNLPSCGYPRVSPINPEPSPLPLPFSYSPLISRLPSPFSPAHTLTTCLTSFLSPVVMALSARLSNTFWTPSLKTHASDAEMGRRGFLPARAMPTFGRSSSAPPPGRFFSKISPC